MIENEELLEGATLLKSEDTDSVDKLVLNSFEDDKKVTMTHLNKRLKRVELELASTLRKLEILTKAINRR